METGTLIIMGDFNSHFNRRVFVKSHDRRNVLFSHFLATDNLVPENTSVYWCLVNFCSYSGEHKSMIDHILVPSEKVDLLSECRVLDDDALNVSNHRPVYCLVMFPHAEQTESILNVMRSVHWRCAKSREIEGFRDDVETWYRKASFGVQSPEMLNDIDSLYNDICAIISECSEKHLPHTKGFKQFLKPYWDETLKELHKIMKDKRSAWISARRPRGDGYSSYRQVKRLF